MKSIKNETVTLTNGYEHSIEYWVNDVKYTTFILHKLLHPNKIDSYEEKIFPHEFDTLVDYNKLVKLFLTQGEKIILQNKKLRELKEKQLSLF